MNTRIYELLYIVANKYTEKELVDVQATVKALIEKNGGEIKKDVLYGKRRLAYPVHDEHYGYYNLVQFEMEGVKAQQLDKKFLVEDMILRHLLIKALPVGSVPQSSDLTQAQPEQKPEQKKEAPAERPTARKQTIADETVTAKEKESMKKGTRFDIEKELGITAQEAEVELSKIQVKEKDKNEGQVDLKALDEKLAEIMGDMDEADKSAKKPAPKKK